MEYGISLKSLILSARDVYYVSKWTYEAFQVARHRNEELYQLRRQFFAEASVFAAFSQQFLSNPPEDYGQECMLWVPQTTEIYTKLQGLFAQNYAKVALLQSPEYKSFWQQYSNFLASDQTTFAIQGCQSVWLIEDSEDASPPLTLPMAPASNEPSNQNAASTVSLARRLQQQAAGGWNRLDFAIRNKKNLESLLKTMQSLRKELQYLVPSVSLTHPNFRQGRTQMQKFASSMENNPQQPNLLGLSNHLFIRQISATAETGTITDISESDAEPLNPVIPELKRLEGCNVEPEKSATLTVGKLFESGDSAEAVLIEYKHWHTTGGRTEGHVGKSKKEIEKLGQVLVSAQRPFFPTLNIRGYIDQGPQSRYAFVFDFPEDCDKSMPLTLHDIISCKSAAPDASDLPLRFHIAQVISRGIAAFHADGWVHESMCSESVVMFRNARSQVVVDKPYLVNFEYARPSGADTTWLSNKVVRRHLYQHPERLTVNPVKFHQGHDLYSLGVVLLELGMWDTADNMFETHRDKSRNTSEDRANDSGYETGENHDFMLGTDCSRQTSEDVALSQIEQTIDYREAQEVFIRIAEQDLRKQMGPHYAYAVVACLSEEHAQRLPGYQTGLGIMSDVVAYLDGRRIGERRR